MWWFWCFEKEKKFSCKTFERYDFIARGLRLQHGRCRCGGVAAGGRCTIDDFMHLQRGHRRWKQNIFLFVKAVVSAQWLDRCLLSRFESGEQPKLRAASDLWTDPESSMRPEFVQFPVCHARSCFLSPLYIFLSELTCCNCCICVLAFVMIFGWFEHRN